MPPRRGEVWLTEFESISSALPYEQAGLRPAVVISVDQINAHGRACIVVPISTTRHSAAWHLPLVPPSGGLERSSFALCEQVRLIAQAHTRRRLGVLPAATMQAIARRIQIAIGL